MWIFKDSIKNEIDTNSYISLVKRRDIYTNIHYKKNCNIAIWEFKDLKDIDLRRISINRNVNLSDAKFSSGEILNENSDLEITVNYGFCFANKLNLNLDGNSKIERSFNRSNYKGFYGTIYQMSLSNEKYEHQILFNYTNGQTPTILLFYKGHNSFYLILINSEKPFDESIIDILNLN